VQKRSFRGIAADKVKKTILKSLRHTPEQFGLQMDPDGWVYASELVVSRGELLGIDQRSSIQDLETFLDELGLIDRVQIKDHRVRATYGHSTKPFEPSTSTIPDQPLFHGTSANNWAMIECFGLSPFKRRFVQLTTDYARSRNRNRHGRKQCWIRCSRKFPELSVDRLTDMLMVNVVALTRLTRKLFPAMLQRRTGGILNAGSIAAYQAGPNVAVYYASKAYVLSFTEALLSSESFCPATR